MNSRFTDVIGDYFGTLQAPTRRSTPLAAKHNDTDTDYVHLEIQSSALKQLIIERKLVGGDLRNLDIATKQLVHHAMLMALTK